jgi:ComF family protein
LRDLVGSLFAVVFPASCALCDQEFTEASWCGVCRNCWSSLNPWAGAACARCGLPIASDQPRDAGARESTLALPDFLCSRCRTGEGDFDLARSFGVYRGSLRAAILQLKFHRRERLGKKLGVLLAPLWTSAEAAIQTEAQEPLLIVPVPLHSSRQRERGFNQAELLARGLARALARPGLTAGHPGKTRRRRLCLITRRLRRTRATELQTGLSLSVRQRNVRGAFAIGGPECFRDRLVVLVDDVMTTGATASACAAVLKRAGARQVVALTLARATPQFPDFGVSPPQVPVDDLDRDSQ